MPDANRFTVYAYDLVTGALIGEIPDIGFTFTESLNRAGSFEVTIPAFHPYAGTQFFEPAATQLVFDDGDVIRFVGIVWETQIDPTGDMTFSARGEGIFSYYQDGQSGPRRTIQSRVGMTYATLSESRTLLPNQTVVATGVAGFPDTTNLFNNIQRLNAPNAGIVSTFTNQTGFVDGYGPTPGGGMNVAVAAGHAVFGGTTVAYAGGSFAIGAADTFFGTTRVDLLYISSDGVPHVVAGTPAVYFPSVPDVPAGGLDLAHISVPPLIAAITVPNIEDHRGFNIGVSQFYTARFDIGAGDLAGETIANIQLVIVAQLNPAVPIARPRLFRTRINVGGVDFDGTTVWGIGYYPIYVTETWETNPATGLAWTAADVESFGSTSSAGWFTDLNPDGNDSVIYLMNMIVNGTTTTSEVSFANIDQFRVVADLLDHAAVIAGPANVDYDGVIFHGSSGTIDTRGPLSDVAYTRTYFGYEGKGIGQAITEIAQRFGGFDFSDSWAWDTTTSPPTPRRYFNLWYPRRGQVFDDVVVELGSNIELARHTRDGGTVANPLRGIGAGTGSGALSIVVTDMSLLYPASRYPYIEGSYSAPEENLIANLSGRTQSHLSVTKLPVDTLSVDVSPNADLAIGDVNVGDALTAILAIPGSGWTFTGVVRIVQQTIAVTTEGLDRWTLDLALDAVSIGTF